LPCCQAASTVAAACVSGMLRNMLPNGAAPKPSGPLISLSLMLMIPPRVRSRGLCQPSSLPHLYQAFRLDTTFDRRPVVPGQTPGIQQVKHLTGLTRDKALRVRIQKALAIDYLRNEMRMLGAASVGPIDMGRQVTSVARVGPTRPKQ